VPNPSRVHRSRERSVCVPQPRGLEIDLAATSGFSFRANKRSDGYSTARRKKAVSPGLSGIQGAGRNLAIEISGVQSSKVTSTGMSIATFSGAHPTMLVIMVGPSSSFTSATT
jgi:hypothetical protein